MPSRTAPTSTSVLQSLSTLIPKTFDQVQSSSANHHKNFVALHKLHSEAASQTESVNDGAGIKLVGERAFEDVFLDMVTRVLNVKKGAAQAERVVKFVGGYTKFINEKAAEQKKKQPHEDDEDDDTPASRFTSRTLRFLLKGFVAKDKTVRYRVVHLVAEMVAGLGEIDEDLYTLLRSSLLIRINDKESSIRARAVVALSKLCGSEDPEEVEDGEKTVVEVLTDVLSGDPSADVRRAALLNIPLTPTTLPAVLSRTRDTDTTVRRLVYASILEPQCDLSSSSPTSLSSSAGLNGIGGVGVGHPRALTIAQRELVVRNGLGDREAVVKSAAGSLVGAWVDVVGSKDADEPNDKEKDKRKAGGREADVVALLKLFDLAESAVAEDALLSVFKTRVDIFDGLEFDDAFWTDLTPERAFLARVFVSHCIATKDEARLEGALPVVTALAFRIQGAYNALLEDLQGDDEDSDPEEGEEERQRREDERMDREFVIGEMLKLAVDLDYADEIGRRKMFQLVRDMIGQEALPESLVARCLDILRTLSPNERDLIRVVVEVVHELRDTSDQEEDVAQKEDSTQDETETTIDGETEGDIPPATPKATIARGLPKPVTEMSAEEKAHADGIDLRCLSLCIGMLERVNGTFEENSTLEGILADLIIPAVKRKELALREKGLVSLGLCCLIARRMALNSFQLFLGQIQTAPEILKIRVLQIVFDILMVHEGEFLGKGSVGGDRILEFLLHVLENEESEKIQALLCMGLAKLMLAGMASEDRVLTSLIVSYLSPDTADNQELRQCLSYFFPVYCYSSPVNQRRVQEIFIPMFEQFSTAFRDLDSDQDMVTPAQVGAIFVDWTDPQKAIDIHGQAPDDTIHIHLASNIVKALYKDDMEKDDKKALCQLLGKLHLPEKVDDDQLRTLKLLMHNLRSRRPLRDTTANNAFTRFDATLSKKYKQQLEDFNEEEYRQLEYLKDLFEFLDDIIPEDDEEDIEPKKRIARKRRSDSVVTDSTAGEDVSPTNSVAPSKQRSGKGKSKPKRRRLSTSDDEDDDSSAGQNTPPASVAPTRTLPKRAASGKKHVVLHASSDESEEEEDRESTPAPPSRKVGKSTSVPKKTKEEVKLDAEIDDILESDVTRDSIMDSEDDGDDDEEEVNSILASEEEL